MVNVKYQKREVLSGVFDHIHDRGHQNPIQIYFYDRTRHYFSYVASSPFENQTDELKIGVLATNHRTAATIFYILYHIIDERDDPLDSCCGEFLDEFHLKLLGRLSISEIVDYWSLRMDPYIYSVPLTDTYTVPINKSLERPQFNRSLYDIDLYSCVRLQKELA